MNKINVIYLHADKFIIQKIISTIRRVFVDKNSTLVFIKQTCLCVKVCVSGLCFLNLLWVIFKAKDDNFSHLVIALWRLVLTVDVPSGVSFLYLYRYVMFAQIILNLSTYFYIFIWCLHKLSKPESHHGISSVVFSIKYKSNISCLYSFKVVMLQVYHLSDCWLLLRFS